MGMQWGSRLLDGATFYLFGKLIAKKFVVFGGVPAVLESGRLIRQNGMIPTYNRIDEHVRNRIHIKNVCASYIELVARMNESNCGNIAIKPSALGMELGSFVFVKNLQYLVGAIKGKQLEIEVDAEARETLCTVQTVLNFLKRKLPDGITFRPAFQMHLPQILRDELITKEHILRMPIRIVKGSGLYNTDEAELHPEEIEREYFETFRHQIEAGKHPYVATVRDKEFLLALTSAANACQIFPERYTIQFLAGPFGGSLARQYVTRGYRVSQYVTFVDPSRPDEWKGYVKRRIAFGRKLFFG